MPLFQRNFSPLANYFCKNETSELNIESFDRKKLDDELKRKQAEEEAKKKKAALEAEKVNLFCSQFLNETMLTIVNFKDLGYFPVVAITSQYFWLLSSFPFAETYPGLAEISKAVTLVLSRLHCSILQGRNFISGSQEGRERGRLPEVLEVERGEASERNGTG